MASSGSSGGLSSGSSGPAYSSGRSSSSSTSNPFTKKKKLTLTPEAAAEAQEPTDAEQAAAETTETVATPADVAKLMLPPTPAEVLLPKSPLLPRDTASDLLTRIVTPPTLMRPEAATAGLNLLAREGAFNQAQAQAEQIGGNLPAIQARLEGAAQNYRDLPINATPQERQAAMQQYSNMLEAKAVAGREAGGAPHGVAMRPMQETGAITMAQAFGKPPLGGGQWPSVVTVADRRIANIAAAAIEQGLDPNVIVQQYRSLTPAQQGQEYYNLTSRIQDPNAIGGAQLLAAGPQGIRGSAGMIVPHVEQEQQATSDVNKLVNQARDYHKLVRSAQREVRFAKDKDAKDKAETKLVEARADYNKHLADSRLGPNWNVTAARQKVLTDIMTPQAKAAQAQLNREVTERQAQVKPSEKSQQNLADLTEKRRLREYMARAEEERRKKVFDQMRGVYRA